MSGPAIRPWRPVLDAEPVARVWRRAWASANPGVSTVAPHGHWLDRVRREFQPPCEVLVVDAVQGLGAFMVLDLEAACVAQLFADPDCQGRGLGRALLDEACCRLPGGWMLHVATGNRRALAFYARYGLVPGAIDHHPVTGRERVACRWQGAEG